MKVKAIISVKERVYTIALPGNFESADNAREHVRATLLDCGVFVLNDREVLEINCLGNYEAIRVVEDLEAPVLPAVEPAEDLQLQETEKEYNLANVTAISYLGQPMDVSLLVYYASNDHKILMPTVINGSHASGYMGEKNVVELMHKVAQQRLLLPPNLYTVLLYPGPLLDMGDGIEYLREWAKGRDSGYVYTPKIKNAKAFHGWNEKGE